MYMLTGRGWDDGTLNITIKELGTTLGAVGNWGFVSIPVTFYNGITNKWVTKPWYDEAELAPPRFANTKTKDIYNVKLV